ASMGAWLGRMPTCPSHAGATTAEASPSKTTRSGDTTRTLSVPAIARSALLRQALALGDHALDAPLHVERLLGEMVELAARDALERLDRVLELHVLALDARERLGHVEGLREEALDAARATDDDLVLLGQLVHAQD